MCQIISSVKLPSDSNSAQRKKSKPFLWTTKPASSPLPHRSNLPPTAPSTPPPKLHQLPSPPHPEASLPFCELIIPFSLHPKHLHSLGPMLAAQLFSAECLRETFSGLPVKSNTIITSFYSPDLVIPHNTCQSLTYRFAYFL